MRISGSESSREQHRAERRDTIVDRARELAEDGGWDHVTTRRLAEAIGFSQPVVYSHFPGGKREIVTAVALHGFEELSASIGDGGRERLRQSAAGYLAFADRWPATYDAMFASGIDARFAADDTPIELRTAWERVASLADGGPAAEVLWSALHGMATLERAGRMRAGDRESRLDALVARFS